ncbi:hypothetical protein [Actinoplanes nipponensis]|nr:hypothetical protein [Actinoplanes nipponensis]
MTTPITDAPAWPALRPSHLMAQTATPTGAAFTVDRRSLVSA